MVKFLRASLSQRAAMQKMHCNGSGVMKIAKVFCRSTDTIQERLQTTFWSEAWLPEENRAETMEDH